MITDRTAVVEMTVALLVMAGTVQAATVINTCPFVIASPGDYVLSANLSCFGGGTGITITSSHVTLKLEGHTIVPGGNGGTAIGTSSGTPVTDVHILGPGRILSFGGSAGTFAFGVSLVGSVTDSEVRGITVQGSTNGINATGQGLTLTKNTLAGGTVGISLTNLTSSTISENVATGYTVGILIVNANGTSGSPIMLSQNIVIANPNTGVDISSGFATVQNNIMSGNGTVGINVSTAANALQITNNTAVANGTDDLNDPFRIAREPCGTATRSSRLTEVAFIEEAG